MSQQRVWDRGAGAWLVVGCVLVVASCGGQPKFSTAGGTGKIDVQLSAGTAVAGATVTVYAVDDDTGQVDTTLGSAGVIGVGGPTDSSGNATITLSLPDYS